MLRNFDMRNILQWPFQEISKDAPENGLMSNYDQVIFLCFHLGQNGSHPMTTIYIRFTWISKIVLLTVKIIPFVIKSASYLRGIYNSTCLHPWLDTLLDISSAPLYTSGRPYTRNSTHLVRGSPFWALWCIERLEQFGTRCSSRSSSHPML